jgi:anti-sigma factor RsiW
MEANLVTYLDGKASPAVRRQAEEHLAACAGCRERAAEFRRLWSVLEEAPAPALSASFDAAVRERMAREPRRADVWTWLGVRLMPSPRMALAMAATMALSIWLGSVRPGVAPVIAPVAQQEGETEFSMIQDLPVLEDYDVVASFDALAELPTRQPNAVQGKSQR